MGRRTAFRCGSFAACGARFRWSADEHRPGKCSRLNGRPRRSPDATLVAGAITGHRCLVGDSDEEDRSGVNSTASSAPVCPLYTTPVTEQFGAGLAHEVFDDHAGRQPATGLRRAACGRFIVPAAMTAPAGPPCPACQANLAWYQRRHDALAEPTARRHWWSSLSWRASAPGRFRRKLDAPTAG